MEIPNNFTSVNLFGATTVTLSTAFPGTVNRLHALHCSVLLSGDETLTLESTSGSIARWAVTTEEPGVNIPFSPQQEACSASPSGGILKLDLDAVGLIGGYAIVSRSTQ